MLTSEKAIEKLTQDLVNRFTNAGIGFRIYQDSNGTGEVRLALKLDNKKPEDETVQSHGIQLILDPSYSAQLKNFELDYLEGPSGGFVLKDKNKSYPKQNKKEE